MFLPFLFFLVATARLGVAVQEDTPGSAHHPPLLDCAPTPPTPSAAFRANLASALGALPSAAAAAPKGFATAHSGAGRDRAFARGLCFSANATSSPAAARACRACLSAAARDATTGRCGASRRAGFWHAGCFLAYADTKTTSPREDAFRGWFYAGPNTTAATLADRVCAGGRPPEDCDRCFEDAALAGAALRWLARIRGQEVLVVGYGCALRVRISVLPQGAEYTDARRSALGIWLFIMIFIAEITILSTLCAILENL